MESRLIAFCGVDCAACPDYAGCRCPGCLDTLWPEGDACMPAACCRGRGIAVCGECAAFPCPDMAAFYRESESHGAAYARMRAVKNGG